MAYGWSGRLLRVDLSTGTIVKEDLNEEWAHQYVGGRGLGARYLYEDLDPKVEPLSPENELIFATGPMTGTNASCGARYMVVTKSPLTGTITTSNSGGHWGPGAQVCRVRHGDLQREIAEPGLPVDLRRRRATRRCESPVGQGCVGDGGHDPDRDSGPGRYRGEHRACR